MKPELLAPAGDLERLKVAFAYGADAVYIGGTAFSLRARASNFTIEDIALGCAYAHGIGKKVYVTMNIIPTAEDLDGLDACLAGMARAGVDAVIASAPVVIDRVRELTGLPVHLSTQQSVTTSAAARFWERAGVNRIVLARELTTAEIGAIRARTAVGLEVFVHGGMCASYSGRCTISDVLADRDANRGGCAHSCRWHYRLYENGSPVSDRHDFSLAAKDLEGLVHVPALIDAGVDAFKIEGRMKSANYVGVVTAVYRAVIDDHRAGRLRPWAVYRDELAKAENRRTADGFLGGMTSARHELYDGGAVPTRQDFLGCVETFDAATGRATFVLRNPVAAGDAVEASTPAGARFTFTVAALFAADGTPLETARRAGDRIALAVPRPLVPYAMLRKVP